MGLDQSVQENNERIIINHPRFRKAELLQDHDIIRTSIPIQNESHFEQWSNNINKISDLDDEVLLLPRSYRYVRRAICGSSGQLNIDFDKYAFILQQQLRNRRNIRRFFDQGQLWYLLYSLTYAANDFKKINSKIGDVRPANIFINEEGQVKIANMLSWPNQPSNYIKTLDDNQKTYLAPEQMENIRNGDSENYIDKYKAESFSIGLTLLQAGLMREMSPLYNSYARSFDQPRLDIHLKDWLSLIFEQFDETTKIQRKNQYSDSLKLTIAALCNPEINNRLTSQQIFKWLKPYSEEINNLRQFKKDLPPVKNMNNYEAFLGKRTQKINQSPSEYNNFYTSDPNSGYRNFFHNYSTITGHENNKNYNPEPNRFQPFKDINNNNDFKNGYNYGQSPSYQQNSNNQYHNGWVNKQIGSKYNSNYESKGVDYMPWYPPINTPSAYKFSKN